MKKALITGVTGQDGSYLAELLLSKGYEVHGLVRRASLINTERIDHIFQDPHEKSPKLILHYGDLSDASNLNYVLRKVQPTEIYNLGAQSHVRVSFEIPEYTSNVVALGTLRLLDAVRETGIQTKIYQASSSEIFGDVIETPQRESTPFNPASPYGAAKVFAHHICVNYRRAYGMFIVSGILFNHESPRRGRTFVTRKITEGVVDILTGMKEKIYLGNLDARRDWGYAPEYVKAMWMMLQKQSPSDYVIATGESHSIREFLDEAFSLVGVRSWEKYIGVDPRYYRPQEVNYLLGDYSKAEKELGWKPQVKFKELVKIMLESEFRAKGIDPMKYMGSLVSMSDLL